MDIPIEIDKLLAVVGRPLICGDGVLCIIHGDISRACPDLCLAVVCDDSGLKFRFFVEEAGIAFEG